jgi:hypothetical protein
MKAHGSRRQRAGCWDEICFIVVGCPLLAESARPRPAWLPSLGLLDRLAADQRSLGTIRGGLQARYVIRVDIIAGQGSGPQTFTDGRQLGGAEGCGLDDGILGTATEAGEISDVQVPDAPGGGLRGSGQAVRRGTICDRRTASFLGHDCPQKWVELSGD